MTRVGAEVRSRLALAWLLAASLLLLATWSEWGGVASAAQVPVLPQAVVARINRGLSSPKRMGVVNELQREAMNKS